MSFLARHENRIQKAMIVALFGAACGAAIDQEWNVTGFSFVLGVCLTVLYRVSLRLRNSAE